MSISVSAARCQTWFDQTSVSVVLVPTTVFAQKIHKLYFPYHHLYTNIQISKWLLFAHDYYAQNSNCLHNQGNYCIVCVTVDKIPLVIFSLGMESCQTVFSGVLPGVESIISQKSQ